MQGMRIKSHRNLMLRSSMRQGHDHRFPNQIVSPFTKTSPPKPVMVAKPMMAKPAKKAVVAKKKAPAKRRLTKKR